MKKKNFILLFVCVTLSIYAVTINIPEDYATIQEGIDASEDGDEVIVAPGTYVENINFNGKAIILGSWFYTTQDTSYISQTIINGNQEGSVVTFISGETSTTVLTGFTITDGNAEDGGGIYVIESGPHLENLLVIDNSGFFGGGIYCDGEASLENLEIRDNQAEWYGGGLSCGSNTNLLNVKIINNISSGNGGGIDCFGTESVIFTDVLITGNSAIGSGGGIYCGNFGMCTLSNVTITNNSAGASGGGIASYHSYGSSVIFDSENRCNLYYNNVSGRGNGSEIYFTSPIDVIVDTFTVLNPSDFHAAPLENFSFDILHGLQEQVSADLYVSPQGDNHNTGLDAANPLKTVQYACSIIQASSVDPHTIYLSAGIYSPSVNGEFFPINIPANVSLCGTGETEVILDAENTGRVIMIDQAENVTVCDLTVTNGYGDKNGGGIYCLETNLILENITVINNYADGWGGGIYFQGFNNIFLNNLHILNNSARLSGGGLFCLSSSPNLTNVMIRNNSARTGGGVCLKGNCSPAFANVTITYNIANLGGGIHLDLSSEVEFSNENRCNIYLNNTNNRESGSDLYSTDAVSVIVDTFTVMNPTDFQASPLENFSFDILHGLQEQVSADLYVSPLGDNNNSGLDPENPLKTIQFACSVIMADSLDPHTIYLAEGIYSPGSNGEYFPVNLPSNVSLSGTEAANVILDADGTANVIFIYQVENVKISNLTITGGYSTTFGGGIYCMYASPYLLNLIIAGNSAQMGGGMFCTSESRPILANVTFSHNSAIFGGGIYCMDGGSAVLVNCLMWQDTQAEIICDSDVIHTLIVAYSDIEGGLDGIVNYGQGEIIGLEGNIDDAPMFNDPESGDYSLMVDSPCIDAGIAWFEYEGEVFAAFHENDYFGSAPDMGALEYGIVNTDELKIENVKLKISIYPNPFNPETTISFFTTTSLRGTTTWQAESTENTELCIYNLKGQRIRKWKIENVKCKINSVVWDGKNDSGKMMGSGVYLVSFRSGERCEMKKLILLK
ncbi:MAG: T9SS type A sorting domain-containing protein [Candidatus Cloacimonetes bacterium]|nr:T9SS type A sorting domain-containing protein [Candidatus Cloacimonadota bacterium]